MDISDCTVQLYETDRTIALLLVRLLRNQGLQVRTHDSLDQLITCLQWTGCDACGEFGGMADCDACGEIGVKADGVTDEQSGGEKEGFGPVVVGDPAAGNEEHEIICGLRRRFPQHPFILLSTKPELDEYSSGFYAIVRKPFMCEDLLTKLKEVF